MHPFRRAVSVIVLGTASTLLVASCSLFAHKPSGPQATARLRPTSGNSVAGTVRFAQVADGVTIDADLTGLAPDSVHGIHVHEKGDCSAPDATSAGGHFNPAGMPHGTPETPAHHAGDMPNLKADSTGSAHYHWKSDTLSIATGQGDIVGRAVVVHRDQDDYRSQPAGNSGPRLACGVIELEAAPAQDD